jgi:hypothetical protein
MTYAASQVAYWVGQANDQSTGNHPTGWTTGQRWSETSSEWQTMYDTQYATARDTSTGTHPTGWTNGQLWSETASEWKAMHDVEYAAARDNSAGQSASTIGTHHPTGWTASQLWSETANEWNAMWGTEWRNSHDSQGFSYSYPGQAANAVFWSQSAQYWRGQYDAYVTNYNNAIANRDYWMITVAHSDAGVWDNRYNAGYSAGNSAGYAAGVAAASPGGSGATPVMLSTSGTLNAGANLTVTLGGLTAGVWSVTAYGLIGCGDESAAGEPQFGMYVEGSAGFNRKYASNPGDYSLPNKAKFNIRSGSRIYIGMEPIVQYTGGGTVTLRLADEFAVDANGTGYIHAVRVPTPSYPR